MDRGVWVLAYFTFRKIIKYILPTLHMGRTQTDCCNSCFSLDFQIKNPVISNSLRQELIAAKKINLEDAIRTRRAISKLIKSVKKTVAPNDPPLLEEPIFISGCFKDPYDRLNRPFVVHHQDGTVG